MRAIFMWVIALLLTLTACTKSERGSAHFRMQGYPLAPFFEDEDFFPTSFPLRDKNAVADRGDLGGGVMTATIDNGHDVARAMTLSSDGNSIYYTGRVLKGTSADDLFVIKADALGVWDTTFSGDGVAILDFGSNKDEIGHAIAWQTNGQVVIAGRGNNGSNSDFALVRYNSDGTLDTNFGTGGKVTHTVGGGHDIARSVVFQTNGNLVAAGFASNGSDYDFVVGRYFTNGTLDSTFGGTGVTTIDVAAGKDNCATALAVMSDGRALLVGGTYNASNNWDIALTRLNTDGTADNSFNSNSKVTTTVGGGDDILWSVKLDSSEHIIAAGETNTGSNQDFLVVKYFTQGTLDTLFSSDGVATSTLSSGNDIARSVALATDGKIIFAGGSGSTADLAIMRWHTDGSKDTTFATNGALTQTWGSGEETALAIAVRNTGQIFTAGRRHNGANYDLIATRHADTGYPSKWYQEAYIKAPNANVDDHFGARVALSGETLAVSAYEEDSGELTIINGSTASTNNGVGAAGAVYVFTRSGSVWTQQAYLKPSGANANLYFGIGLSLHNDTLLAGTYAEDSDLTTIINGTAVGQNTNAQESGAAYVFKRTGSTWAAEAFLKAPNATGGNYFGYTVTVHNDTAVVGSFGEDSLSTTIINGSTASTDTSGNNSGAGYVFTRSGSVWSHQAYLKPPYIQTAMSFGVGAAVYEDTAIFSAPSERSASGTIINGTSAATDDAGYNYGAGYAFSRSGSTWSRQAYLKPGNCAEFHIGQIDQNTAAIGCAYWGIIQVLTKNSFGEWSKQYDVVNHAFTGDTRFGVGPSVSGNTMIAGAIYDDSSATTVSNASAVGDQTGNGDSGATFVFARNGTAWKLQARLKASNADTSDYFGNANAIWKDTIAVGAPYEDSNQVTITNGSTASTNNGATDSGAVYIFRR